MSAAADAGQVAARLREQAARLTAAVAAGRGISYEASTQAGGPSEIAVTVTGLGQVSRVYVGPRAMRSGPDALAPALSRVLNEAVRGARERAAEAVHDAVEPGLQAVLREPASPPEAAAERIAALTGETASASSPDEKVTVTASGAGENVRVRFATTALRGFDNVTLGEQIAMAANAALDAARRGQQDVLDSLRDDEKHAAAVLDARMAAYGRRMDGLLDELDQAERRIDGMQP
jgi:DNA-binding protein YbaB